MRLFTEDKERKYTIEYVSLQSGFLNQPVFNRAFKNVTGVTPSFFIDTISKNIS